MSGVARLGLSRNHETVTTAGAEPDLPRPAWVEIAVALRASLRADHTSLSAAGVAFFGFLSAIPALAAVVSIYGLIASPTDVEARAHRLFGSLPHETRALLTRQLSRLVESGGGALSFSLAVSIAAALWSASSGMAHLLEALHLAYGETDDGGFVSRRLRALRFTVVAVIAAAAAAWFLGLVATRIGHVDIPVALEWLGRIASFVVVGLLFMVGLSVLYRHGATRDDPLRVRLSPGAVIAVVVWVMATIGFQIYTSNFGSYNETYGSLAAVVLAMLWLWLSAFIILVGAEINAEIERRASSKRQAELEDGQTLP